MARVSLSRYPGANYTLQPTAPPDTPAAPDQGWQTFDDQPDMPGAFPTGPAPAPPSGPAPQSPNTFENSLANYWAPDRRQHLVGMLNQDYWAPDRDAAIARYQNMPDAELWPHSQPPPSGGPTGGPNAGGSGGGFNWGRWDELTRLYPGGTVADLERLVRDHPELGVRIVGGSRGDIQLPSGDVWDVILAAGEGGRGWQRIQGGGGGGYGGGISPSSLMSAFQGQFNDPSTRRLEEFLNQRFQRLQQPAYTGPEQEVLRTQALDPIERDRQASRKRGLENISARGFDPSSGIALDLLNQIDAGFDRTRAGAQNQLASQQIQEQRSRDQEAQALLSLLYDLPNRSLQQSLAVLGMGPTPESLFSQAMGLYGIGQQQQQQGAQWWQQLGAMLPYLMGGLGGGR